MSIMTLLRVILVAAFVFGASIGVNLYLRRIKEAGKQPGGPAALVASAQPKAAAKPEAPAKAPEAPAAPAKADAAKKTA